MAGGDLPAEDRHARRGDGDDEGRAVRTALDAAVAAHVDVLGIDRARVHADLAADDHAGVGLAHELERDTLARVLAHAVADRGSARREGEEAPRAGDEVAIPGGVRDLLGRHVTLVDRVEDSERDQVAVRGRVRDVAGAQEGRGREAASHRPQVLSALRDDKAQWRTGALGVRRCQDDALPLRVEVAIVPGHVLVHRPARGRMDGDVLDQAFPDDPDPAPVAQRLAIFRARSHHSPRVPAEL